MKLQACISPPTSRKLPPPMPSTYYIATSISTDVAQLSLYNFENDHDRNEIANCNMKVS